MKKTTFKSFAGLIMAAALMACAIIPASAAMPGGHTLTSAAYLFSDPDMPDIPDIYRCNEKINESDMNRGEYYIMQSLATQDGWANRERRLFKLIDKQAWGFFGLYTFTVLLCQTNETVKVKTIDFLFYLAK